MQEHLNKTLFLLLSLLTIKVSSQTPSIKSQAQTIISQLKENGEYPLGAKDTVIDINGDRAKDLLIEFYGSAGSGLKNRIIVYLYDNIKKKLTTCETLNCLANPTFYIDKKIVAGYYIANGGGYAAKLKWRGLQLDTLEHIEVDITYKDKIPIFSIITYNHITKKKSVKISDAMELPKEYKYWDYQPIIKGNGS
jgi:hypothetical protein